MTASQNLPALAEPKCSPKAAANWAHQTIKLFPQIGEGATEEFIAALINLICRYPESVISVALNVSTGIPVKYDYLPPLSKFKEALDIIIEEKATTARRLFRTEEQIRERLALEKAREDTPRPTYEELMATVPASLKIGKPALEKRMTEEEFLRKFPHVTREQLDATPNINDEKPLFAKLQETKKEEDIPNPFEQP